MLWEKGYDPAVFSNINLTELKRNHIYNQFDIITVTNKNRFSFRNIYIGTLKKNYKLCEANIDYYTEIQICSGSVGAEITATFNCPRIKTPYCLVGFDVRGTKEIVDVIKQK